MKTLSSKRWSAVRLVWLTVLALAALNGLAGTVFTSLHSFQISDGASPSLNPLVQGSDGYFYGTTALGGTSNSGTVFRISTSGALTTLYSFTGGSDGSSPNGVVQGSDGYFYGMTWLGGTNGSGTVFRITTNGVLTTLYAFGSITDASGEPLDGSEPLASLVQASDGYFYGTTWKGGAYTNQSGYGFGTVFKISTEGLLTTLYSFTGLEDSGHPWDALVQGSDGYFYGTTVGSGNDFGTVFKISTHGALTTLHAFTGSDGASPGAGLVQGSDGYFYGTTMDGGTNNTGTVFRVSASGIFSNLYSFHCYRSPDCVSDGANPSCVLAQGRDGYLYGTTMIAGTNRVGTVFRISTDGLLTTLYAFGSITNPNGDPIDGGSPGDGLVLGSDGYFYGTTLGGGVYTNGTVFRVAFVPEQPKLNITLSGANLILAWPGNTNGLALQSTASLGLSAVWTNVSQNPVVVDGQNTVTIPISGTQQFFRFSR